MSHQNAVISKYDVVCVRLLLLLESSAVSSATSVPYPHSEGLGMSPKSITHQMMIALLLPTNLISQTLLVYLFGSAVPRVRFIFEVFTQKNDAPGKSADFSAHNTISVGFQHAHALNAWHGAHGCVHWQS
jgi:hypothetical protein